MNHVEGKVVLVTGAAGGFGRLVSRKVAALGGQVVCADIDAAGLATTCEGIRAAGGLAIDKVTDVTRLADLQALAALAKSARRYSTCYFSLRTRTLKFCGMMMSLRMSNLIVYT